MQSLIFSCFPKAQRRLVCRLGPTGVLRLTHELGGPLAENAEKLLGAAALVALLMADDGQLAGGRTARKLDVDERFSVVGVTGDLRQNGNAHANAHQGFDGGNLRATEADTGFEIVVAAETLDLAGERAGGTKDDKGFAGEIGGFDAWLASQRVVFTEDEQERLGEERLDR